MFANLTSAIEKILATFVNAVFSRNYIDFVPKKIGAV